MRWYGVVRVVVVLLLPLLTLPPSPPKQNASLSSLAYYERIYDWELQLNKLDLVAIPDFEAGAMENWGLITFREAALLTDPASTASERQRVALTVAHELCHVSFEESERYSYFSSRS